MNTSFLFGEELIDQPVGLIVSSDTDERPAGFTKDQDVRELMWIGNAKLVLQRDEIAELRDEARRAKLRDKLIPSFRRCEPNSLAIFDYRVCTGGNLGEEGRCEQRPRYQRSQTHRYLPKVLTFLPFIRSTSLSASVVSVESVNAILKKMSD